MRDALSMILTAGGKPLTVVDDEDHVAGLVTLELVGGLLGKDGALTDGNGARTAEGEAAEGAETGAREGGGSA